MKADKKTSEIWKQRIREYRKSGMTAEKWCQKNNISKASLKSWIWKFNKQDENDKNTEVETEWVEIDALTINEKEDKRIEISKPIVIKIKNASIEVHDEFNETALRKILTTFGVIYD
jgi:hypothetical protein